MPYFERLDTFGVRRRSGPKSDKVASAASVRAALEQLRQVLNVSRAYFPEDERRDYYYLSGPLPEIRIVAGDRRHYGDWQSYSNVLWRILMGESLDGTPGWKDSLFPPASNGGQEKGRAKPASGARKKQRAKTQGQGSEWLALPEVAKSDSETGSKRSVRDSAADAATGGGG